MYDNIIVGDRPCPCCSYNESYPIKRLDYSLFEEHPMPSTMNLVSCCHCGFIYYQGHYNNSHLSCFYQKHYYVNAYHIRAEHPEERQYNEESINILLRNNITTQATVVDVGCGPGHLLQQMQLRGFTDLTGVELSQYYVSQLKQAGFNAYLGSSEKLPIPAEIKVDCFIYKNIFEHLYSLHETLSAMVERIVQGGHVLIEVPDVQAYDHTSQYHPLHYFTLEHINHFDLKHLHALLKCYGFTLIESGTRMLDIAEKFPVPIMYCLFRQQGQSVKEMAADFQTLDAATHWFKDSSGFSKPELQLLSQSKSSIYLWGLSYRTLMQCAMSPLKDCDIKYYIDADVRKQGLKIAGKTVVSPDILINAGKDDVVVIGVGPSSTKMYAVLLEMGFLGKIVILN